MASAREALEAVHHAPLQRPAILPTTLRWVNRRATETLVPELVELTPEQRIEKAIIVFERLVVHEVDPTMKPSRLWSLDYFQASARGSQARRDFLIGESIFVDGTYLRCPIRVQPQMEVANLNPANYPERFQDSIRELQILMFMEYFGVKNLLSFPNVADIFARLGISPIKGIPITEPRLKLSLLLRDYVIAVRREFRRASGDPLVAIFGPGKGEETLGIMRGRNKPSILCLDAHDAATQEELLRSTFLQGKIELPPIELIGEGSSINTAPIQTWRENGFPPTIFIYSGIDFSETGTIPEELHGIARVAASAYVLHEMTRRETLIQNMASISGGSVVVVDGNPTCAAFDNIVLPISDVIQIPTDVRGDGETELTSYGSPITGHDAVATHLLCLSLDDMNKTVHSAVSSLDWKVKVIGPPLPPPLFHKLQIAAIGRPAQPL